MPPLSSAMIFDNLIRHWLYHVIVLLIWTIYPISQREFEDDTMYRQNSPKHSPKHKSKAINVKVGSPFDEFLPCPSLSFSTAYGAVFVIAVLCFIMSYNGDFVFDDNEAILNNKDLTPAIPLEKLFEHDFWGKKLNSTTSHKSYRPLTVFTFRLNYLIAGGLHPTGFHVINIILHGIVSVLLLCVLQPIFADKTSDDSIEETTVNKISFMCALLFAVHPIHTESVAGVVGRADLMCAVLFLLSLIFYIKSCHTENSGPFKWLLYSMLSCAVSVLFKEQGITAIGVCSAYDVIIASRIDILQLLRIKKTDTESEVVYDSNRNTEKNNNAVKSMTTKQQLPNQNLIIRHSVLFLTGILLLIFRWRVMGSKPPVFQEVDNPHSFVDGTILRGLNYNYLYSLNVWLLLNPWWLCFDWAMGCVPVIASVFDYRLIFVIVFWMVFVLLSIYCLWSSPSHLRRLTTIALAFLVIPFLPASNLLFRVGFVIAERNLYLPSIGYCILVTNGICILSRQKAFRKVMPVLFWGIVLLHSSRCIQRSIEWKNEKDLFTSGAKVCPLNAKVHYNIAKVNADDGNVDIAIKEYRIAIELFPDYDQALNNLGNILNDQKQVNEAETLLLRAVKARPEFAAAWMNLGIVQSALKKNDSAELSYLNAIKHRRNYPDCYYNLGNLYLGMQQNGKAIMAWQNATKLRPTHNNAWSNMIILLDNMGDYNNAEFAAKEALRYLPHDAGILYNFASCLGKQDRYKESETYFLRAIKIQPTPIYYVNLGVLYHRWGKFSKAEKAYLKSLEMDPNSPNAHNYLAMVRRKMQST